MSIQNFPKIPKIILKILIEQAKDAKKSTPTMLRKFSRIFENEALGGEEISPVGHDDFFLSSGEKTTTKKL